MKPRLGTPKCSRGTRPGRGNTGHWEQPPAPAPHPPSSNSSGKSWRREAPLILSSELGQGRVTPLRVWTPGGACRERRVLAPGPRGPLCSLSPWLALDVSQGHRSCAPPCPRTPGTMTVLQPLQALGPPPRPPQEPWSLAPAPRPISMACRLPLNLLLPAWPVPSLLTGQGQDLGA